jgi:glycosyltransferase involved in cell wall biosynthesis
MIVRNEADVIARCLRSVRPLITHWCIVDTGSQDDTRDVIQTSMVGVPGELVSLPWSGFSQSRNDALRLARSKADYILFIDADDFVLLQENGLQAFDSLRHDCYYWFAYQGTIRHRRVAMIRSAIDCKWHGDLHEHLSGLENGAITSARLEGISLSYGHDGARGKSPDSVHTDIDSMIESLSKRPSARTVFYLGMTYLSIEYVSQAYRYLRARAEDYSGDEEERWFADFQTARIEESTAMFDSQTISSHYARCISERPFRAEACVEFARYLREKRDFDRAYELASYASTLSVPTDEGILVDISAYEWRALDELAISAAETGKVKIAKKAIAKALEFDNIPDEARARLKKNFQALDDPLDGTTVTV